MSASILRRGLLVPVLVTGLGAAAVAQTGAKLQGFANPDAAAQAFTDAVRAKDAKALKAMLGEAWVNSMMSNQDRADSQRQSYLAAWDSKHAVPVTGGNRAKVQVGNDGWTFPVPIVKDGSEWRFDVASGIKEVQARQVGHDEYGAIQSLIAIVAAQNEYAALDPMKTGWPQYARRLLSSPGLKDGLYWPTALGEPPSPIGAELANSQYDGSTPGSQFGYNFRLLYAQGPAAAGGAHDYIADGRMIGGFAAIAWPVVYGVTGVMTFIVNYQGFVYQQDLGPQTGQRALSITSFNPDKGWQKADTTAP